MYYSLKLFLIENGYEVMLLKMSQLTDTQNILFDKKLLMYLPVKDIVK